MPAEALKCPHCGKGQALGFVGKIGLIFLVGIIGLIIVAIIKEPKMPTAPTNEGTSSNIENDVIIDDQIYREFEICMNWAKENMNDNKLATRDRSAFCMTELQKYGDKRAKKAFNMYFSLK